MRLRLLILCGLLGGAVWPAVVVSQPLPAVTTPGATVDAQRLAISARRQQLTDGFLVEDAACYQRFAVNKCLAEVDARRRVALGDLRRQDLLLNDQERKRRATDQLRRVEEKQDEAARQAAADRRAKALSDYQNRLLTDAQKKHVSPAADAVQTSQDAAGRVRNDRLKAAAQEAQARSKKQAMAADETVKFNERQAQAAARQAKNAQKLQQQEPGKRSNSLPVPP